MSDLFYCRQIQEPKSLLTDSEAHHAINVLRMKAGDSIRLFDGHGTTADGRIQTLNRRAVVVAVDQTICHSRQRSYRLTVAAAPPKGDRLKWMMEKLTELGVDRFIPLKTTRTVVQPGEARLKKLESTIISAAKQAGCLWLMEISEATTLQSLLTADDGMFYFAHPGMESCVLPAMPNADQTVVIGPEGGFTDEEVECARSAGVSFMAWAGSILRIETAAVVFAATVLSTNNRASPKPDGHSKSSVD